MSASPDCYLADDLIRKPKLGTEPGDEKPAGMSDI